MSSAEALSQQRCRGGGGCDGSWKLHQNHDKNHTNSDFHCLFQLEKNNV